MNNTMFGYSILILTSKYICNNHIHIIRCQNHIPTIPNHTIHNHCHIHNQGTHNDNGQNPISNSHTHYTRTN